MLGSKGPKKNPNVWLPILELEKKSGVIPSRNKKVGMDQRASEKVAFWEIGSYRMGTTLATGLKYGSRRVPQSSSAKNKSEKTQVSDS